MTRGSVRSVIAEYDPEARATYLALTDRPVARTVSVSDLVIVDIDDVGEPVGVEFALEPARVTNAMLTALVREFPALRPLVDDRSWLLTATS